MNVSLILQPAQAPCNEFSDTCYSIGATICFFHDTLHYTTTTTQPIASIEETLPLQPSQAIAIQLTWSYSSLRAFTGYTLQSHAKTCQRWARRRVNLWNAEWWMKRKTCLGHSLWFPQWPGWLQLPVKLTVPKCTTSLTCISPKDLGTTGIVFFPRRKMEKVWNKQNHEAETCFLYGQTK